MGVGDSFCASVCAFEGTTSCTRIQTESTPAAEPEVLEADDGK